MSWADRILYAHKNPPTTRWRYFRVIQLPKLWWYASGMFIWDEVYSYWWLNIKFRNQIWDDAGQEGCPRRYCRYCGKGAVPAKIK